MSKKEYKDYINQNGFFVNFNAKRIDKASLEAEKEDNATRWKKLADLPKWDNILVFEGIASQNYGLWEKNRNGYKIDQKGWMFDNYIKNPIMLLQHNHEYGGIWHSLRLYLDNDWNLVNRFYVDVNTLDEKTKYQVENWFISAVSTSHISHEDMVEDNDTGERMTIEEAREAGISIWSLLWFGSDQYTLVTTKAEMIENSMVTIGSNEDALVSHNSIWNYFNNKYSWNMKITKAEKEALLNNDQMTDELRKKVNEMEVVDEETTEKVAEETTENTEETTENTETTETTEEVTEENTEETTEENPETKETEEETTEEETKTSEETVDETSENEDNIDQETSSENEEETSENDGENATSSESDEETSESDEETSENEETEETEEKRAEENSPKKASNTSLENTVKAQANTIKNLESNMAEMKNEMEANKKALSTANDAISLLLENTTALKKAMANFIVDGVDAFEEKAENPQESKLAKELKKHKA